MLKLELKMFRILLIYIIILTNCCYASKQTNKEEVPGAADLADEVVIKNLTIDGSASVFSVLRPHLSFLEQETSIDIELVSSNSISGINNLIEDKIDVAMISTTLKFLEEANPKIKQYGLKEIKIADSVIAFVVNNKNKVRSITLDDVKSILYGSYNNWSKIGGDNQEILIVAEYPGSGVRNFIENNFLSKKIDVDIKQMNSQKQVVEIVEKTDNALGIIDYSFVNNNIRALNFERNISHPLVLVYKSKNEQALIKLMKAINKINFNQTKQ